MAGVEMRVEEDLPEKVALRVAAADFMDARRHSPEQPRRLLVSPAGMRQHVARSPCDAGGQQIPVTVSFGVMPLPLDEPFELAVRHADSALYRAKRAGRDRVVAGAAA